MQFYFVTLLTCANWRQHKGFFSLSKKQRVGLTPIYGETGGNPFTILIEIFENKIKRNAGIFYFIQYNNFILFVGC